MKYNPRKHRLPIFKKNGILLVDKPKGWTSHDVVNFVRVRFNVPKVGHCGTLDPAATGLLVIVLGKFTKLSQKFSGEDKVYEGTILLGTETDSQDMDGSIVAENDYSSITEQDLRTVMEGFLGEQDQIPPMVSAKKQDGKKLYELAREGVELEREPKLITVNSFELKKFYLPHADFEVSCSKGTYVRTLCFDIGRKLGCGGVLFALNRTASGDFSLEDAVSVDTMKEWTQDNLQDQINQLLYEKIAKNPRLVDF